MTMAAYPSESFKYQGSTNSNGGEEATAPSKSFDSSSDQAKQGHDLTGQAPIPR